MSANILDLDVLRSINHLGITINPNYMGDLIYKLIETVKQYGKNIGILYRDIGQVFQYLLRIKYLGNINQVIFEFDTIHQFINIVCYNNDQTKTYLKIFLSIIDEPTIKYIENDRSGFIPSYCDEKISLKPGEYLINISHCLLAFIGFNRVRLDDDSCLVTKNNNGEEIRTKLWLYYLLKNGKSWYSKFGYEPGNSSIQEYNMLIADVRKLKLQEISACLKQMLAANNKCYLDTSLVEISGKIVALIGQTDETLYQYTNNHSLEKFTCLTNNLTQSMYSKNVSIEIQEVSTSDPVQINPIKCDSDDESDDDSDDKCDSNHNCATKKYITLSFPWFYTIKNLLVANVMQINNNIHQHYYLQ